MTNEDSMATNAVASTDFDLTEPLERTAKAKYRGHDVPVTHTLRRPTLAELQQRDIKNPYRSQQISENEERILSDASGKVDVKLYEKLVQTTKGYATDISEEMTDEQRKAALKGIPSQHKTAIVRAMVENKSEVVYDNSDDLDE